uniref:Putative conserved secreted protein n=1 Tax=Anopheles darlingi TaxID=43151 RepID=A0A2M4CZX5_ANODA
MKVLTVSVVLAVLAIGTTLGSTVVVELQNELNELSTEIERAVQQKRTENSAAILATTSDVLTIMGNHTAELREIVAAKRTGLEVEQWLCENDTFPCFEEAFRLWDTYAYLTGWDISWCAVTAYEETNADAQYTFHSHAQTIVREAARALRLATEAYELHSTDSEQQATYLSEELEYLRYLWGNYQPILQAEIDGHDDVADTIVQTLDSCFEDVHSDVEYWFNYLDTTLETCLNELE